MKRVVKIFVVSMIAIALSLSTGQFISGVHVSGETYLCDINRPYIG